MMASTVAADAATAVACGGSALSLLSMRIFRGRPRFRLTGTAAAGSGAAEAGATAARAADESDVADVATEVVSTSMNPAEAVSHALRLFCCTPVVLWTCGL